MLLAIAGCRTGRGPETKITPDAIAREIHNYSVKGNLLESDLESLNQMAKSDRAAFLRALVTTSITSTNYDEADIGVGLIAYYDFSATELINVKSTARPKEINAYEALIRETRSGDFRIRREEVLRRLKTNGEQGGGGYGSSATGSPSPHR